MHGISLAAVSGGYSLIAVHGLLIVVASLVGELGLQDGQASAVLLHVESPWSRDRTHVPCIGRQILNHWTTREVLEFFTQLNVSLLVHILTCQFLGFQCFMIFLDVRVCVWSFTFSCKIFIVYS